MVRVIATALALFFTGAALADDWKDYENRDYAFTVNLPGGPGHRNRNLQRRQTAAPSRPTIGGRSSALLVRVGARSTSLTSHR